ncbi:MAG: tetratricopeptide repeat protein [Victivallales bacterium]|nr:tetratricopeptide repeat protein [Victivallales bacterium]
MKNLFLLIFFAAYLFTTALIPNLKAYDDDEEEFSPWAAWRKGFSYSEKGERNREKGKLKEALEAYRKAYQYYHSVKKERPNWSQKIIGGRIKICEREIRELKKLLGKPSTAEVKSNYAQGKASSAELQNTKAELINYRKKLFAALMELNELRERNKQGKNNLEQVEDLMREKRIFTEEYKLLEEKLAKLQKQKKKPSLNEQRLKTQLVDIKIKNDIIAQRLKLQQEKEKELNEEIAGLYRYKTQNKNTSKEFKKAIENLKYKLTKSAERQNKNAKDSQKLSAKVKSLETHNKQISENLQDKEKEIKKLGDWLKQLRKKSGNQSEIQQEIIKANQLATKKYQDLKKVNEKNIRELQESRSLQKGNDIAEEQLKKTLQEINNQRGNVEKEYELLRKSYTQLLIIQKANTKEIKMLHKKQATAEELVKTYSEKYKWIKSKLAARSNSDLQNISSLRKQIRNLNKKIKKEDIINKTLKLELSAIKNKNEKLETSFASLKKANIVLKFKEKLLVQETQSSQILKTDNKKLRETNEALRKNNTKVLAEKRKEYQIKIKENEKKLIALQKQNQGIASKNNDLNLAAAKVAKLREELHNASKTIQILRKFGNKKDISTEKHTASVTKYTPQIKSVQTVDLKVLLADGIKAEKNDSEDLAIWNYRKYLSSKPDKVEVNRRLGSILYKRGQIKEAALLLKKAYSSEPDNANNASVYAQILIKQKKFTNASVLLQTAIKKHPQNYSLLIGYAKAQAGEGKTTKALENLDVAIKLSPKAPQAYLARAQIIAIYYPDLLDSAAKSYRKARNFGAKPDIFLEDILAKKLSDNSEMIQFLQKPAIEAERGKDWVSAAWYFGQLHKLKPAKQEYQEKYAAALLLQGKNKESLKILDLKNLSNAGRLIAASAEISQGNYPNAAEFLKDAKQSSSMKVYFKALKESLKTISDKIPSREKEIYSKLNKLL